MSDDPDVVNIKTRKPLTEAQRAARRAASAKGKEVLRRTNHKPASGLPAAGEGWGGEARGPGFGPEAITPGRTGKPAREEPTELIAEAIETMTTIMRTSEYDALKLAAADKLLNRLEGLPVARNLNTDASGAELLSALMDISRERDVG